MGFSLKKAFIGGIHGAAEANSKRLEENGIDMRKRKLMEYKQELSLEVADRTSSHARAAAELRFGRDTEMAGIKEKAATERFTESEKSKRLYADQNANRDEQILQAQIDTKALSEKYRAEDKAALSTYRSEMAAISRERLAAQKAGIEAASTAAKAASTERLARLDAAAAKVQSNHVASMTARRQQHIESLESNMTTAENNTHKNIISQSKERDKYGVETVNDEKVARLLVAEGSVRLKKIGEAMQAGMNAQKNAIDENALRKQAEKIAEKENSYGDTSYKKVNKIYRRLYKAAKAAQESGQAPATQPAATNAGPAPTAADFAGNEGRAIEHGGFKYRLKNGVVQKKKM